MGTQPLPERRMTALEVSKPYIAGRTAWPEGLEYHYGALQHEFRMFLGSPTRDEVEAVRHGECEFALAYDDGVIFFLYRFGEAIRWSDSPYFFHLIPSGEPILPDAEDPAAH